MDLQQESPAPLAGGDRALGLPRSAAGVPEHRPSAEFVQAALAVAGERSLEHLADVADLAASYARSLAEAAFRGDRITTERHIRQLRFCVLEAIQTFKTLDGEGGGN